MQRDKAEKPVDETRVVHVMRRGVGMNPAGEARGRGVRAIARA